MVPEPVGWLLAVLGGVAAGVLIGRRTAARLVNRSAAEAARAVANLETTNALLRTLISSPDIPRSLFELALRIRDLVPCDRVGLTLLTADRDGYQTYTARLDSENASTPRGELHFPRGSTVIDEVVTAREPRVIDDVADLAPTYLDANVSRSAGFSSFVLLPLVFDGEALGTLNVASRKRAAFSQADVHRLRPIAEALAIAHGSRRLVDRLARHQMADELSEMTFAFANDMSGAVQAIIGRCELLTRGPGDSQIEDDIAGLMLQAKRLRDILTNLQRMTRERVLGSPGQTSGDRWPTGPATRRTHSGPLVR